MPRVIMRAALDQPERRRPHCQQRLRPLERLALRFLVAHGTSACSSALPRATSIPAPARPPAVGIRDPARRLRARLIQQPIEALGPKGRPPASHSLPSHLQARGHAIVSGRPILSHRGRPS
jgi:hypothetical protein